jgi:hypothetical protein
MIDLQVRTTAQDAPRVITIGPADIIRFERKYGVGVTQFSGDGMRFEWLAYLAWTALKRDNATALEFEPWIDTVEELLPVGQGNDPAAG